MSAEKGMLIVGHGSKSDDAIREFDEVVEMVRQRKSGFYILGAHMEINHPSIPDAIDLLMSSGIIDITVVPYFLFKGKHSKFDIPQILKDKKSKHPQLKIRLTRAVGVEPLMAEILLNRALDTDLQTIE